MAIKLDLRPIVKVDINLSAKAAARKGFNVGLILGSSDVIPVTERVRVYTSPAAMLADGFSNTSDEYVAARLYFNQSPQPDKLCVGVIDTANSEDKATAMEACRQANSEWYEFVALGAADAESEALGAWAESATPRTLHMYTTHSAEVLQPTYTEPEQEGEDPVQVQDIFMKLKANNYRRSWGVYNSGNVNAAAAWMGRANGLNSGTANSMFTMAYKSAVGITTDSLTEAQVEYVCGSRTTTGNNGNVYVTRAEDYDLLQQGYMADGTSFDEIMGLDMLENDIVLNVMDLLAQSRKVPQTEAGVASIINVINQACDKHVRSGFIAPGQWNGAQCLELMTGDYLDAGYLVQAESIDSQPQADRDKRIAPTIYVCVKLAGAIEFVVIEVNINR